MAKCGDYSRRLLVLSLISLFCVTFATSVEATTDSASLPVTENVSSSSGNMTGTQITEMGRNVVVAFSTDGAAPGESFLLELGATTVSGVQTEFYLFNLVPGGDYDVHKNSVPLTSVTASYSGAVRFTDNNSSSPGDQYLIVLTGVSLEPPSAPTGLTATGRDDGCAALVWNPNPEPDIFGYTIYYGTESVEGGAAPAYTDSIVLSTTSTHRNVCGLADGTYYFALRAKNAFGLLSPLSAEVSAVVTNGNTQGPLPPQQVSVSETSPGCATVTWRAGGEPDIEGYYVYYGELSVPGEAPGYSDSVDAGDVTSVEICDFSQGGTFYFAVRTYTTGGNYSSYSEQRQLVVDVTGPTFAELYPADGAGSVLVNTNVAFAVLDHETGADSLSVFVRVNGIAPSRLIFAGEPESLLVSCTLAGTLPENTQIDVFVRASDQATFANTDSITWSFTTGSASAVDTTGPVFCCESPANGSVDVDADATISIQVSDVGSGIDFANVFFLVNSVQVPHTIQGDHQTAVIRYANHGGFPYGATINVAVIACDRTSPPNCTILSDYSFKIVEENPVLTSEEPAIIVPDGYWANDPDKPMEVRNLPANWTVRIFTTAGVQVKSFTNQTQQDVDWVWDDFANDSGRRVTRALYFVRVTGPDGKVRRTGRFVVQKDP